jgi:hypothetical protein
VEVSCEHSNEPSGSIKCWEILEQHDVVNVETCRESDEFRPISRMCVVIGCGMVIKWYVGVSM